MAGTELLDLGTAGGVRFSIAITNEPWTLNIDAIVVSAGSSGLGNLGRALSRRFQGAAWDMALGPELTASRPYVLRLPTGDMPNTILARAVLIDVRTEDGAITEGSLRTATVASLRAAGETGARAIGLPLLAAGALGESARRVARAVVPAAVDTVPNLPGHHPDELIFVCEDRLTAAAIDAEFALVPTVRTTSPLDLAGGVSSDLVDPNRGIALSEDRLGVAPYVSMLATVIADRSTPLPLSVGVFGEWGSGKSFFMAMLRERIRHLGASGDPRYCQEIVQIGFNAWHYTDTNLWASLGDEIFRQLAGTGAVAPERAERLRAELSERLDQRQQLEIATAQARDTVAELQAKVHEAVTRREASAMNLIRALRASASFRRTTERLWRQLGISEEREQARVLAEQLEGTLGEAELLRRATRSRVGWLSLVGALALGGFGLLVAIVVGQVANRLALGTSLSALVAGLSGITYLVSRGHAGLRRLRSLREELADDMHAAAEETVGERMSGTLKQLRAAEAEQRVAQAQLDDVVTHVGELGRQLAQLAPGRRLYTFLAERAQGDSYAGNLGLVSMIRKDFQQLVTLMDEWRRDPEPLASRRPIDRVVLYIDDLDRCSPAQVVDVLQAVHLLLAFELFIVVVGVDPRWLLRSLRSRYSELLVADEDPDADEEWHSPEDYLEKILNVPLILPRMSAGSLGRLLKSFAGSEIAPVRAVAPAPEPVAEQAAIPIEPGSEVDTQHFTPIAAEPPHPLTDRELAVLSAFDLFVETPREAKRMLNLYRMIRSTRDLSSTSRFLGLDQRPGEFEAVAVLLGVLAAQSCVVAPLFDAAPNRNEGIAGGLTHRDADTPWSEFLADIEPRWSGTGRSNGIIGQIPNAHVPHWHRLHRGLTVVGKTITFPDLADLQLWLPRVRCFSYVIHPMGYSHH
ncbi:P-loop NTPase fold protein [Nocardia sp. NPDC003482]